MKRSYAGAFADVPSGSERLLFDFDAVVGAEPPGKRPRLFPMQLVPAAPPANRDAAAIVWSSHALVRRILAYTTADSVLLFSPSAPAAVPRLVIGPAANGRVFDSVCAAVFELRTVAGTSPTTMEAVPWGDVYRAVAETLVAMGDASGYALGAHPFFSPRLRGPPPLSSEALVNQIRNYRVILHGAVAVAIVRHRARNTGDMAPAKRHPYDLRDFFEIAPLASADPTAGPLLFLYQRLARGAFAAITGTPPDAFAEDAQASILGDTCCFYTRTALVLPTTPVSDDAMPALPSATAFTGAYGTITAVRLLVPDEHGRPIGWTRSNWRVTRARVEDLVHMVDSRAGRYRGMVAAVVAMIAPGGDPTYSDTLRELGLVKTSPTI